MTPDPKPTIKARAAAAKAVVEARRLRAGNGAVNPSRREITRLCKKWGITRKQFRKLYKKGKRNAKEVQAAQ